MKKISLVLSLFLMLNICSCKKASDNVSSYSQQSQSSLSNETNSSNDSVLSQSFEIPDASNNDEYDETQEIRINLSSETSVINNNGYVVLEDGIVWILGEGEYILSGNYQGQVIVSAPEKKVQLELRNAAITCDNACPMLIFDADKCEISIKSGTENKICDLRKEESEEYNAAIYAQCDLEVKGKGSLEVTNEMNNGIHTKDDLVIKNVSLEVKAVNNAIKGNDSLTIESGKIKAISTKGDCLKTDNSDISSKGNQRGTIKISGGEISLYAACDCIDASYDVVIENDPVISCFTDSYSEYSEEVSVASNTNLYLKVNSNISNYRYAVLFTLENNETVFVNSSLVQSMSPNRCDVFYSVKVPTNAVALQLFAFNSNTIDNSTTSYVYQSEAIYLNDSYDCLSVSLYSSTLSLYWTTYTTTQRPGGGPGGMGPGGEGNNEKADYSCKGIKADNLISISGGIIDIKSHDDGIHANGDKTLENGNVGLGNILIYGGNINIYTNDDGIHADNTLTIDNGNINITKSYEGLEANIININGGVTTLVSRDDEVNASAFKQTPCINITGGVLYLNANGDGLDSNGNIVMTGGYVLALGPTNGGNGVLDYDRTFTASGGYVLAIGCSGMNQGISASGNEKSSTKSINTSIGSYVVLTVDGVEKIILKVLKSNQNYCAYCYSGSSASVSIFSSNDKVTNGLYYIA